MIGQIQLDTRAETCLGAATIGFRQVALLMLDIFLLCCSPCDVTCVGLRCDCTAELPLHSGSGVVQVGWRFPFFLHGSVCMQLSASGIDVVGAPRRLLVWMEHTVSVI